MFTSRAEHRLLLREDNADRRLGKLGHEIGLLDSADATRLAERGRQTEEARARLEAVRVVPTSQVAALLRGHGVTPPRRVCSALDLARRPEIDWRHLDLLGCAPPADPRVASSLLLDLKYEGYVARQSELVARSARLEDERLPEGTDFAAIPGLSAEVRERLERVRPATLGQASRIPGVTPAAIALLGVHLRRARPA
jgi:tRNA uridine 5-carboxymethylaminomethyl modification enzyme